MKFSVAILVCLIGSTAVRSSLGEAHVFEYTTEGRKLFTVRTLTDTNSPTACHSDFSFLMEVSAFECDNWDTVVIDTNRIEAARNRHIEDISEPSQWGSDLQAMIEIMNAELNILKQSAAPPIPTNSVAEFNAKMKNQRVKIRHERPPKKETPGHGKP